MYSWPALYYHRNNTVVRCRLPNPTSRRLRPRMCSGGRSLWIPSVSVIPMKSMEFGSKVQAGGAYGGFLFGKDHLVGSNPVQDLRVPGIGGAGDDEGEAHGFEQHGRDDAGLDLTAEGYHRDVHVGYCPDPAGHGFAGCVGLNGVGDPAQHGLHFQVVLVDSQDFVLALEQGGSQLGAESAQSDDTNLIRHDCYPILTGSSG